MMRQDERVREMEAEMARLRAELQAYRDRMLPAVRGREDEGYTAG